MNIDFPYQIAATCRTRETDFEDHVRDMIELLLLTNPRERVMRPDFGTGCLQYVHAPNRDDLVTTLQATLHAALTRWLGDVIDLVSATVESVEAELHITVCYIIRFTGKQETRYFTKPIP
jgi:phage baseplate assembly protein W